MPAIDEDEATLAVAAARALLKGRSIDPRSIERIAWKSETGRDWAKHAQIALGLSHATLVEHADGPLAPHTLGITASVTRPGATRDPNESVAVAEYPGEAKDIDASDKTPLEVDPSRLEKIANWESKALAQMPMGAYVPRATWEASLEARYRLLAGYCQHCKRGHHPRLDPCPVCGGRTEERELQSPGQLYSFTTIAAGGGPTEFDPLQDVEGTYGVGIVDFGNLTRVAGLLTETQVQTLAIGQRMEPVFRRIYAQEGSWRYGTKFRPHRLP